MTFSLTEHIGNILSVSDLNQQAKSLLLSHFGSIWVEGEISNMVVSRLGHTYFSLKDEKCQINCVLFNGYTKMAQILPENGLAVLIHGQVTLYLAQGKYQLVAEQILPIGVGKLQQAFAVLYTKLEKEGLFREERKRSFLRVPQCIGIITSSAGAALHDVLTTLKRRAPYIPIIVYPCTVQGENAPKEIQSMIEQANQHAECDVLLIVRGGGSIEDLWAFNEERVARSIFASAIPVITGIGHETDHTISDMVADQRAATPTAAAEIASRCHKEQIQNILNTLYQNATRAVTETIKKKNATIMTLRHQLLDPQQTIMELMLQTNSLESRGKLSMQNKIAALRMAFQQIKMHLHPASCIQKIHLQSQYIEKLSLRLHHAINAIIKHKIQQIAFLKKTLPHIHPDVLTRNGYALLKNRKTGKWITTVSQVSIHDQLNIELSDGQMECDVLKIEPKNS